MTKTTVFASAEVLLALMLLFSSPSSGADKMNDIKEEEMYNCYYTIICKAREPYAFKDTANAAGKGLHDNVIAWLKELNDFDASDTPEFWEAYPDLKCALTEEQRRNSFEEFIRRCGEYWAEVCKDQDSEECVKTGDAAVEFQETIARYFANGVCTESMAETGEAGAEKAGEMAEEGMDKFKSFG